jgi:hypothetical protein
MTIEAAKKKLHEIIDKAGEKEIFAFLSLIEEIGPTSYTYDEATLQMLRERSELYHSGKMKTYSIEESMERIRKQRKHGL